MEVNLKDLCAICKFAASRDPSRFYINGVHVRTVGTWVHFVATDGLRLAIARMGNDTPQEWAFTIPREMLERIKFTKRASSLADLTYDDGTVTIQHEGTTWVAPEIAGGFPDYSRIRPNNGVTPAPSIIRGDHYAAADALAKSLDAGGAIVTPLGRDPALLTFERRDDVWGMIAPVPNAPAFADRPPF